MQCTAACCALLMERRQHHRRGSALLGRKESCWMVFRKWAGEPLGQRNPRCRLQSGGMGRVKLRLGSSRRARRALA